MTENTFPSKYVFMSYSRRDEAAMQRIAKFLREKGINVWVDNEKLVPGTPIWEEEIEKAIRGAAAVAVALSPDSKESVWVRREISLAEQNQKRIFPIMVAGDEDSSITLRLITSQFVDIRENEMSGLNSLKDALFFYLEELERGERVEFEEPDREVTTKVNIHSSTKNESKSFLLTWVGRSLVGFIFGILLGSINYSLDSSYFDEVTFAAFTFVCIVSGLLVYPNKRSILFLFLGFLIAGVAFSYDSTRIFTDFTAWGVLVGSSGGALFSRMIFRSKKSPYERITNEREI